MITVCRCMKTSLLCHVRCVYVCMFVCVVCVLACACVCVSVYVRVHVRVNGAPFVSKLQMEYIYKCRATFLYMGRHL